MLASLVAAFVLLPQLVDKTAPSAAPQVQQLSSERRGDIYMARKMYREAVESYQDAVRKDPKSYLLYNKMGIAYHQQIQLDQAQRSYERAYKLNNRYSEAINNIGTVHYAKGRYRQAINAYRKALQLTPNAASIHSNLGTAYFARKRFKEASEAYLVALKLDPEIFEHRGSFGSLLQERTVQDRARFHYYLAKTYAAAGYFDRAILYLRRALEEGLKEREKIHEQAEFAAMKDSPEFQQLMAVNMPVLQQ